MRFLLIGLLAACGGSDSDSATPTLLPSTGSATSSLGPNEVLLGTELGDITLELFPDEAPITVANFLDYVDSGFFDGDDGDGAGTFYRAVPDFVLQGGGVKANGTMKDTNAAITNEAIDSGLSNEQWTVAMARTNDPNSATTEFFVNLVDNDFLDPGGATAEGYAVFGKVVGGKSVINDIMDLPTSGESLDDPVKFTDVR